MKLLDDTEDWLYGDGEDETKTVYQDRLAAMKVCPGWVGEGVASSKEWREKRDCESVDIFDWGTVRRCEIESLSPCLVCPSETR